MPATAPSRPGWPSLKTTAALAPAASALLALTPKVQVPRWTSAIEPAGKPAKSAASQPEFDVLCGRAGSIGTVERRPATAAVTSPEPEYVIGA